jgi:hypothetical protein
MGRHPKPFTKAVASTPFLRFCVSAGRWDRTAGHLIVGAEDTALRLLPLVLLGRAPYIDCK